MTTSNNKLGHCVVCTNVNLFKSQEFLIKLLTSKTSGP